MAQYRVTFGGCVVIGSSAEEAMDKLLAKVQEEAVTEIEVSEGAWLPPGIGEHLPIPPDEMVLVVLERCWPERDQMGEWINTGYEWRHFALPQGEHAPRLATSYLGELAHHSPKDHVIDHPINVVHFEDRYLRSGTVTLPSGSLEYLDGAWMACAEVLRLPYRLHWGEEPPVLPEGFGLMWVKTYVHDSSCSWGFYAVPLGSTVMTSNQLTTYRVIDEEPTHVSLFWDDAIMIEEDRWMLQLPEGSFKWRDGCWQPCREYQRDDL